jgi:hypothetical protein
VNTEWRVTAKPGKLYFIFFNEPRAPFPIPPIENVVKRAYQLADGKPVELTRKDGVTFLTIERPILDPLATVVVVEIEGDKVQR